MTENVKTITFVGIGLLAVVVALVTRPSSADLDVASLVGEVLTKDFASVSDAKRLRIVRFDDDAAALRTFEVAEQNGLWTLPSKDGYPADATQQMAEAATSLMDRKILEVTSMVATDHVPFGVVDPLGPNLEVGQKGVGTRVTISNAHEEPLVDLIIGKEVKDLPGKHFVRKPGQDIVYVVEVDPSRLSTKFEDWIEKDLLKFSSFDLQQVEIKDYSAELRAVMGPTGLSVQPTWDPRAEMTVAYDDKASTWNPVTLRTFKPEANGYVDFTLAEDEELNSSALNGLKTALADLAIVDVERKPQGLSQNLQAGEDFLNNQEALRDLMSRGFTPAMVAEGGARDIISSDGEVIATMKNGAEYVLRFGDLVQVDEDKPADGDAAKSNAAKDDAAKAAGDKTGIHRYLFVMARFNEAAVKKPELADLPELPAGAIATEGKADEKSDPAGEGAAASKEDGKGADPPAPFVAQDEKSEGKAGEESKQDEKQPADQKGAAEAKADAKAEEKPADAELEKIIADRKRIGAENERKLDEYQETLKKGREKVKDLNLRFGDWYFVVGNDVFTKIRLGRDQVIKKKASKEGEADAAGKSATDSILGAPGTSIPGLPELPKSDKK
jgi:hypothetical protein